MKENPSDFLIFANKLADATTEIIQRDFRKTDVFLEKEDFSPVTETDKILEKKITKMILQEYPNHAIYGEEQGIISGEGKYIWYIDPIDGTASFIAGRPIFTSCIGLMKDGEMILGLVNQAINGERWFSLKGGKTFFSNKNKQEEVITNQTKTQLSESVIATTSPRLFSDDNYKKYREIEDKCKLGIYGGDAYSYMMLAMGNIDIIIEENLKPYDFAALIPIIKGVGGVMTDWHGNEIIMKNNKNQNIIAAANKDLLQQTLPLLA